MIELKERPSWVGQNASPWGVAAAVDCYECDSSLIRSKSEIQRFTQELVDHIDMKAFGPCHVVHFGEDERVAGFSMFQLIETSCISAHFANATNTAYIDIFSCKAFDIDEAAQFCHRFFGSSHFNCQVNQRW